MVKKRAIEVSTQNVEDKMDTNGALRNVAVKDAWARFRQKIEVKAWREAESVLQEVTENLQKINLLKAVSTSINKLKAAFQNPEEMVEDGDVPKETSREDRSRTLELANDLQKSLDDISKLEDCLRTVKQKMGVASELPTITPPTSYTSNDVKSCYESLSAISETYKKKTIDFEESKAKVETMDSKIKDLEHQLEDRDAQLNHLSTAIETLEKKHNNMKEQKMDEFKDQMKVKSLERQVETKDVEIKRLHEELADLKQRFDTLMKSKSADIGEANNPFPPSKIGEKYMELYSAERVSAVNYYKDSENKNDREACSRVIELLQECYRFCENLSQKQMEGLSSLVINPSSTVSNKTKDKLAESGISSLYNTRKGSCKLSTEHVKNAFITNLEETSEDNFSLSEITGCLPFIEKCVEICWAAVIQSPPLRVGYSNDVRPEHKSDIDTAMFDVSEGKGKKIDYILWPPLLSSKDASVITKGQTRAQ